VVHGDGSINTAASDARRAEMTDPDQQRLSTGDEVGISGLADNSSHLKTRAALTVCQAPERLLKPVRPQAAVYLESISRYTT